MKHYCNLQNIVEETDGKVIEFQPPMLKKVFVAITDSPFSGGSPEEKADALTDFVKYCELNGLKYTQKHLNRILNDFPTASICYIKDKNGKSVACENDKSYSAEQAVYGHFLLVEID